MNPTGNPATQARLIAALADPAVFGPGCERVRHLETHISHVLLTGTHAYKIKKPVNLGFLDFTTLAQRQFYCEQELRLNRRLAMQELAANLYGLQQNRHRDSLVHLGVPPIYVPT